MPQPDPWIGRLIASVRRHVVPVIFGERPHPQRPASINLASGVVVDLGRGPFLITASHVINRAREREDELRFHFLVGQSEIPFTLRIVSDSATLDVATLTLTRDEASEIEKLGYPIVQPPSWPPPDVNPGADVIAAGFPAHGRSSTLSIVRYLRPIPFPRCAGVGG